jgi:hypothetical protein
MKWNIIGVLYWVAWLIAFIFWETAAGLDKMGGKDIPMLTQVTVRWVPWYITMPFLTWLWLHFALRYHNAAYLHWLRGR